MEHDFHELPRPPYRDPWLTQGFFARLTDDNAIGPGQPGKPVRMGLFQRVGHWLSKPFRSRSADWR